MHLAVATLGWVAFAEQAESNTASLRAADRGSFLDGQPVTLTAHVIRELGAFATSREHIQVESEEFGDNSQRRWVAAGIRLNLYLRYSEDEYGSDPDALGAVPWLRYGDRLRVIAKLRPFKNFRNPEALDYVSYLDRQGIVALGSGKLDSIESLGNTGDRPGRWQSQARSAIILRIHELWPERQAGLMGAMLIGERAFVERELAMDFHAQARITCLLSPE
jgi:predicted membrane metal-binding protein